MKFGKYLRNNTLSKWEDKYLDYKELKKLLMDMCNQQELESRKFQPVQQPQMNSKINLNSKFIFHVWDEFNKVDKFVQSQEGDIILKSKYLESSKRDAPMIISTMKDLEDLITFIKLNLEGFRKILKKFDKKTKTTLGSEYYNNMIVNHIQAKISILYHFNEKFLRIYSNQFGDPSLLKTSEDQAVFSFSEE
ncbi:hypothetical protein DLAC_08685 [Tieghemostelium lacteum]|uniref:SPX domain-containing protein n=1 Tax=Tieghemostelium lacteum TaxID=361077 RepID=A0A151Z819_TIELA|nr:hypothetical protein DLAC_08685 [Tieghemostelium lacteum]|eukprot:KYQ90100.1 hypothetical protein DLAC_08685 [Tieghemostelium lacteum]